MSTEDCGPSEENNTPIDSTGEDEDVLSRLQHQLNSQLKMCHSNRDHNRDMGNIAEANRFEHLAVRVKEDLDVVVVAKRCCFFVIVLFNSFFLSFCFGLSYFYVENNTFSEYRVSYVSAPMRIWKRNHSPRLFNNIK